MKREAGGSACCINYKKTLTRDCSLAPPRHQGKFSNLQLSFLSYEPRPFINSTPPTWHILMPPSRSSKAEALLRPPFIREAFTNRALGWLSLFSLGRYTRKGQSKPRKSCPQPQTSPVRPPFGPPGHPPREKARKLPFWISIWLSLLQDKLV